MKLRALLPIIAFLLLQSCQYNNAEHDENKIVKKNRSNEAASYNTQLGLAYLKQGDRPRAKRKLLTALAQAPNSPEVNASMAWFLEQSGEMDNAQVYYRKAMTAAPGNGAQLNNYGAFLCRHGQYSQSDIYFLRAIKDAGYENTAGAYENAGVCAAAIPDYAKAAAYFSKALEQDPLRKQSLYELVNIEVKLGHKSRALACLQDHRALIRSDPVLLALAAKVARDCGQAGQSNFKLHL